MEKNNQYQIRLHPAWSNLMKIHADISNLVGIVNTTNEPSPVSLLIQDFDMTIQESIPSKSTEVMVIRYAIRRMSDSDMTTDRKLKTWNIIEEWVSETLLIGIDTLRSLRPGQIFKLFEQRNIKRLYNTYMKARRDRAGK